MVPVWKGSLSAEASPASFHAVCAESEQGADIPSGRGSTNVHLDRMGGFPVDCWTGSREEWWNGGRGKTKPPSLVIYNGLTQSV